jgi:hypothetical protein
MGTDVTVFANHTIDFSSNNFEIIANNISSLLDNNTISNRTEIQDMVHGYYDWQGYDNEQRNKWHKEIENWTDNNWEYSIDYYLDNYTQIHFYGPFNLEISFTDRRIQFCDPGCRYNSFFDMDKKIQN